MNLNMLQLLLFITFSMWLQALEMIYVKSGAQKGIQLSSQEDSFQDRNKRLSENPIAESKLSHLTKLIGKMHEKIEKIEAKLDMASSHTHYNQEAQRDGNTNKTGLQVQYLPMQIFIPIQKAPAVTYNNNSNEPSMLHWNSDKNSDNPLTTHLSSEEKSETLSSPHWTSNKQSPISWSSKKNSGNDSDKPLSPSLTNDNIPPPPLPWIKATWTKLWNSDENIDKPPPSTAISDNKNNDKPTKLPRHSDENSYKPPPTPGIDIKINDKPATLPRNEDENSSKSTALPGISDNNSLKPAPPTSNSNENSDNLPPQSTWNSKFKSVMPPPPPWISNMKSDMPPPPPWISNMNIDKKLPPPPQPPWISNKISKPSPPPPLIIDNNNDKPPPPPWSSGMQANVNSSPDNNMSTTQDVANDSKKEISAPLTKRNRLLPSHSTWIHKRCSEPCGVDNTPDPRYLMRRSISPNRIVGGVEAAKHKYPWQVFIQIYFDVGSTGRCGGSIINDHYVLTAAHCTYKGDMACSVKAKPEDITVTVAEHNIDSIHDDVIGVTDRHDVDRIIRHHMYCRSDNEMDNDIALLRLKKTLIFIDTPELGFVCLPEDPWENYIGEMGIVSGWGYTQHTFDDRSYEDLAAKLQEVAVRIHENCDEHKNQEDITHNMFCAGNTKDVKDACSGDSGGPLVVEREDQHQLVGIVSFGPEGGNCTGQGVYVRVYKYIQWIRENTLDADC